MSICGPSTKAAISIQGVYEQGIRNDVGIRILVVIGVRALKLLGLS